MYLIINKSPRRKTMFQWLKNFFSGNEKAPTVAEVQPAAPYKVETPAPVVEAAPAAEAPKAEPAKKPATKKPAGPRKAKTGEAKPKAPQQKPRKPRAPKAK